MTGTGASRTGRVCGPLIYSRLESGFVNHLARHIASGSVCQVPALRAQVAAVDRAARLPGASPLAGDRAGRRLRLRGDRRCPLMLAGMRQDRCRLGQFRPGEGGCRRPRRHGQAVVLARRAEHQLPAGHPPVLCRSRRAPLSRPRRRSGAVDPLAGADLYSHAGLIQCAGCWLGWSLGTGGQRRAEPAADDYAQTCRRRAPHLRRRRTSVSIC